MIRLIRAEFLKLRTTQVWFWLLMATLAIAALTVIGPLASSGDVTSTRDVPDLFAGSTGSDILVFVLGVLGVTTEFRHKTITPTLLQTPSRWAVVGAKMIAYLIVGIGYALCALVLQLAIALPWLSSRNIDFQPGNSNVQRSIGGVFLVLALFAIIGLGVGALLRNQIVAVVVGIVFLLVIENVVLAIPKVKNAYPYLPDGAVSSIVRTTGSRTVNDVHLLSGWPAVGMLLLWAFVPAVVGAAISLNRDIT